MLGARLPNTIARRCRAGLLARLPNEAPLPLRGLLGLLTVSLGTCESCHCQAPKICHLYTV